MGHPTGVLSSYYILKKNCNTPNQLAEIPVSGNIHSVLYKKNTMRPQNHHSDPSTDAI
jgi:hypothetical protein